MPPSDIVLALPPVVVTPSVVVPPVVPLEVLIILPCVTRGGRGACIITSAATRRIPLLFLACRI
jgi:hypothetical protein